MVHPFDGCGRCEAEEVGEHGGGKSPGVVGFGEPGVTVPDVLSGVSLPVLGWAIA